MPGRQLTRVLCSLTDCHHKSNMFTVSIQTPPTPPSNTHACIHRLWCGCSACPCHQYPLCLCIDHASIITDLLLGPCRHSSSSSKSVRKGGIGAVREKVATEQTARSMCVELGVTVYSVTTGMSRSPYLQYSTILGGAGFGHSKPQLLHLLPCTYMFMHGMCDHCWGLL